jgi:hypothetical protein
MKIINDTAGEYMDVINSFYELERFDDNSQTDVLFQGYLTSTNNELKEKYKNYNKRTYLNLEAPCGYCSTTSCNDEQEYFTHVYTLCPYTCDWMNKTSKTKFIPIPFPYNKKCFEKIDYTANKVYDVMYMGGLLGTEHYNIINIMKNYNYVHASISGGHDDEFNPTHVNISSEEKWDLLSKSKVSIAMNLAPIYEQHTQFITKYDNWQDNEAFKLLESGHIPQFKPRVIESMMCRTLVLVRYDDWNVIEKWFEPGKHFIYWYNLEDLFYKLYHVVNNYKSYQPIVDAAYDKVQEYEISKIYEKIKNYETI